MFLKTGNLPVLKLMASVLPLIAALLFFLPPAAHPINSVVEYILDVKVFPENGKLTVSGTASGAQLPHCFYLNQHFRVKNVRVDDAPASAKAENGKELPYVTDVSCWALSVPPRKKIQFEYEGDLKEPVEDVNLISDELVELALYSGWYPLFGPDQSVVYKVSFHNPSSAWRLASNADTQKRNGDTWVLVRNSPAIDIAIVSSPSITMKSSRYGSTTVELFAPESMKDLCDNLANHFGKGMAFFRGKYGPVCGADHVRCVISPRGGWGYSRLPLIVVSEERIKENFKPEGGGVYEIVYGNLHELAHFWWMIASSATPDDCLNEGLAEFSAFRYAAAKLGADNVSWSIDHYFVDRIKKAGFDAPAISKTDSDSKLRGVNRYMKMTLLLSALYSDAGTERVDSIMKSFHGLYAGKKNATIDDFVNAVKAGCGPEMSRRVQGLLREKWTESDLLELAAKAHEFVKVTASATNNDPE